MPETALSRGIVAAAPRETWTAPEISIVVPTLNENGNVPLLFLQLGRALGTVRWEVIFVDDDSGDGTAATARSLARRDPRVRCIRRIGRRDSPVLASRACWRHRRRRSWSSMRICSTTKNAFRRCSNTSAGADLVVGTRLMPRWRRDIWSFPHAQGRKPPGYKTRERLTGVTLSDPMSGFFLIRQEAFEAIAPRLSTQGFKLLFDIVASRQVPLVVREVAYSFARAGTGSRSSMDWSCFNIWVCCWQSFPVTCCLRACCFSRWWVPAAWRRICWHLRAC